jgi:hypothetical protein
MAGEIYVGFAHRSPKKNWRYQDLYRKAKPSYAKALEGEGGPSWDRTNDPQIMSFLCRFLWVYTDLYLFVPVYIVTEKL